MFSGDLSCVWGQAWIYRTDRRDLLDVDAGKELDQLVDPGTGLWFTLRDDPRNPSNRAFGDDLKLLYKPFKERPRPLGPFLLPRRL